jgi:hypothetical protein
MNVGVPVRVHDRHGDDLGIAHVPVPVEVGDVLELGVGPLLLLRIVDLVEAGPPLAGHSTREGDAGPRDRIVRLTRTRPVLEPG